MLKFECAICGHAHNHADLTMVGGHNDLGGFLVCRQCAQHTPATRKLWHDHFNHNPASDTRTSAVRRMARWARG